MGCNCGKNAAAPTYVYTAESGQQTTGLSEIQARAMQIRAGGKGTVQVK